MLVRLAQHGDEPYLIEFSKLCYEEMDFDQFGYKFEYEAGQRNFIKGIDNPAKQILTVWDKGVLHGLAVWCISDSSQYFDNHRHAAEIVFHALPGLSYITRLKIMRLLEEHSYVLLKNLGVKSMYINTDVRFSTVTKMLEKQGYKPFAVQLYREVI